MTVNTVNQKIYIGVHITETPYKFDNYWGDGITGTSSYWFKHPKFPFQRACKKYGLDAFRRYTIKVFETYEEALQAEKEIVNEEFIHRPDTYNVALGGGSSLVVSTEKPVYQYDLEGNFIKEYRSQSDAARKLGLSNMSQINHAVLAKGICKGYYWSETKKTKMLLEGFTKPIKEVYSYNLDGTFDKVYDSVAAAARDLDVALRVAQRAVVNGYKCAKHYLSYEKLDKFSKKEKIRVRHKEISRYSLSGEYIDTMSFTDAKMFCGKEYKKLRGAIAEHYSCCGYIWSYEKVSNVTPVRENLKKKIEQYDLEGNLIKIWDSYRECNKEFSKLGEVLKGNRSQTKGYKFKYSIE